MRIFIRVDSGRIRRNNNGIEQRVSSQSVGVRCSALIISAFGMILCGNEMAKWTSFKKRYTSETISFWGFILPFFILVRTYMN